MEHAVQLIVAMARHCRVMIESSTNADSDLPPALHRHHLLWMCCRIEQHAQEWPVTKLHRWIGYIQGGMMANRILDFETAKSMFDAAKATYEASDADTDLLDHLDPASAFIIELGGQG